MDFTIYLLVKNALLPCVKSQKSPTLCAIVLMQKNAIQIQLGTGHSQLQYVKYNSARKQEMGCPQIRTGLHHSLGLLRGSRGDVGQSPGSLKLEGWTVNRQVKG